MSFNWIFIIDAFMCGQHFNVVGEGGAKYSNNSKHSVLLQ